MQKSKTHFPSSLFRVDLSMHYTSRFSSYVNACINPKTLFLQKIIRHASKPRKSTFLFLEGVKVCFFGGREGLHCRKRLQASSKVALTDMSVTHADDVDGMLLVSRSWSYLSIFKVVFS